MLSILIPTYNYNVVPLVLELQKQAESIGMDYEILVQDDASQQYIIENSRISTVKNCSFYVNTKNLGRGKNINLLAEKAKFDYALIMEADALPENENYLNNFIQAVSKSTTVIFGGVQYPKIRPSKEKILRWKYGINREAKPLHHRLNHQYDFVFTWNLLLRKDILLKNPFPQFVKEYGYEDVIFIKSLSQNSIPIVHLENLLIHFNDEPSIDFIKKTEKAVDTLYSLIYQQKINYGDTKLTTVYSILKKMHSTKIVKALFIKSKKRIIANLTSENPSIFLLDAYKLGHFCSLTPSKNV